MSVKSTPPDNRLFPVLTFEEISTERIQFLAHHLNLLRRTQPRAPINIELH